MAERALTIHLSQPLWEAMEKLGKAQDCSANQVALDALEFYLSGIMPRSSLPAGEEKTILIKKLYKEQARHRLAFDRAVAEGKIHPLPKDIPLEQVWKGLAGIEGSLAAEVIKEREEGW